MSHLFEFASSGRAKCRGCGKGIARGELRFGERLPDPFSDTKEMTLWFHPVCAAYKRPEPVSEALADARENVSAAEREVLERVAGDGLTHRRLPRADGVERATSGQAACRSCRQPIARGSFRIRLVFFEGGRFSPGGYVHLECRKAYFETEDMLDRLLHFSAALNHADREALIGAWHPEK